MTTGTVLYTGELVVTACPVCGIYHGVPSGLYDAAQRDHSKHVYCPLGHSWIFLGETEAAKFKRLYGEATDRVATARAERDQAEASRRAWKGQATRARNKVLAGECPFCGQHVYQLSRHIGRLHADEAAKDPETEPVE